LEIKTLLIEIRLDEHISKSDLSLRHLLVSTIEKRELGEVVDETSSAEMMEVVIEVSSNRIKDDLKNLLISLGFNDYRITDITQDDG